MFDPVRRHAAPLFLVLTSAVAASTVAAEEVSLRAGVAGEAQWVGARTVAWVGSTRVIPFEVSATAEVDRVFDVVVEDDALVDVVGSAMVLSDERLGFVRIQPMGVGSTTLQIAGATIDLEIRPDVSTWTAMGQSARVTGPATGAAVWGTFTVGVEVPYDGSGSPEPLVLHGSDGTVYSAIDDTGEAVVPYRQVSFEVDGTALAPGWQSFTPKWAQKGSQAACGAPVSVRVVHVAEDDDRLIAGEAELPFEVERPERFADARRRVGRDPDASGGMYWQNASSIPALCFPVRVAEPGMYQVVLRAAGSRSQGALPSVSILIDDSTDPVTNGRLQRGSWHRAAIGVPFPLEAGDHVMIPYFANDFYIPMRTDRNLLIDRVEVLRVGEVPGSSDGDAGSSSMMMMSGGASMMMGGGGSMMMGGSDSMTGEGSAMALAADPWGETLGSPRIGFNRVYEGDVVPGAYQVEGRCWWPGAGATRGPEVTLLINDTPVLSQYSAAPRFWVDPGMFDVGSNTIQMVARFSDDRVAMTPRQVVHRPLVPGTPEDRVIRRHHRFSIHDPGWDDSIAGTFQTGHYPAERSAAVLSSNGGLTLSLPDEMAGDYLVRLYCRGDQFDGPPIAALDVKVGDELIRLGELNAVNGWSEQTIQRATLPSGAKSIVVSFTNDKYEEGKGDRNLWIQALTFAALPTVEDNVPPVAMVEYPRAGQVVSMHDAIVASCSDNESLNYAEVLLDGSETGIRKSMNLQNGRLVLPLVLRSVSPGEHTVAIRTVDLSGHSSDSAPVTIVVRPQDDSELTTYERAVHLLNRLGYGPDERSLASILTKGSAAWLSTELGSAFDSRSELASFGAAYPYFVDTNPYSVQHRAMSHVLLTQHPARARFVLWAENHFSTWIRKIGGPRKWSEHVRFSQLGVGRFDQLLRASAESPAMLGYLDQDTSYAGRLNENYAREIMELHTLGVDGGYAQEDVTTLARLLTGWTVSLEGDGRSPGQQAQDYTWRFDPSLNEGSDLELIGVRFEEAESIDRFDRIEHALEVLASHPSTARFVSTSLAEHYVSAPVPESLVSSMSATFLESGGDMQAVLTTMVEHPEFWSDTARDRIAQPIDFFARAARTAQHFHPWQMGQFLSRCGYAVFDRATPDGYPDEDAYYADSNLTIQRWRMAEDWQWVMSRLAPNQWRYGRFIAEDQWPQLMTDAIAIRLTGTVLGEQSNSACLALLKDIQGDRDVKTRTLGMFIARLPEANLR